MTGRKSGVLLHISSLMGNYGIGTFGKDARRFIDFLKNAGFHQWQVLPFTRIDICHSPYKSDSAFAGNDLFLDPEDLWERGLLTEEECRECQYPTPYTTAYDWLLKTRPPIYRKAFARMSETLRKRVKRFADENAFWLTDYCVYMAAKEATGKDWCDWEEGPLKRHEKEAVARAAEQYAQQIAYHAFIQYLFYEQWSSIKNYANAQEVEIIGDMPIYVSLESVDVWSHRELFELDERGNPARVAGVPPDYFSADGQKWGNPLYDWKAMEADGYAWWRKRLTHAVRLFDRVRIDHFRAFSAYWAVPFTAETAKEGCWETGVGAPFFDTVFKEIPPERIIAEDLGARDQGLVDLLEQTGLPGMRVMQFGFLDEDDNLHLPHNYPCNTVAYSGTHDNNTLLAYLWELTPSQRERCLRYCGFDSSNWKDGGVRNPALRAVLRTLWASHAGLVVAPIQDLCGFGGDTKMNRPGVAEGNWEFRLTESAFEEIDTAYLRELNELYKRI